MFSVYTVDKTTIQGYLFQQFSCLLPSQIPAAKLMYIYIPIKVINMPNMPLKFDFLHHYN